MTDKAWKAAERRLAAVIGGTRVPITGRQRGDAPDVEHDVFAVEVKYRKKFPSWLMEGMEQARMSRRKAGINKIPVMFLLEKGEHGSLAVLDTEDLVALMKAFRILKQDSGGY